MSELTLNDRYQQVNLRLHQACLQAKRSPDSVQLLAVSKTKPLSAIAQLYQAGQRHFGENYVQEAIDKFDNANLPEAQWHFIGPLQSNKTRAIAERFHWVHTVDRLKIARRLSEQRPDNLPALNLLIQVNISDDPAKAGVALAEVGALAKAIVELPRVTLRGLMTITAQGLTETELSGQFRQLKNAQSALMSDYPSCTEVSMGMSADFELAIACGATQVRVGSDLFGPREQPNPSIQQKG